MKDFKHAEKLKELYSEYPYARHLDSTFVSILLCLFYHISFFLITYLYTHHSTVFFFQVFFVVAKYTEHKIHHDNNF